MRAFVLPGVPCVICMYSVLGNRSCKSVLVGSPSPLGRLDHMLVQSPQTGLVPWMDDAGHGSNYSTGIHTFKDREVSRVGSVDLSRGKVPLRFQVLGSLRPLLTTGSSTVAWRCAPPITTRTPLRHSATRYFPCYCGGSVPLQVHCQPTISPL